MLQKQVAHARKLAFPRRVRECHPVLVWNRFRKRSRESGAWSAGGARRGGASFSCRRADSGRAYGVGSSFSRRPIGPEASGRAVLLAVPGVVKRRAMPRVASICKVSMEIPGRSPPRGFAVAWSSDAARS